MMATLDERDIFEKDILRPIASAGLPNIDITGFLAMEGHLYKPINRPFPPKQEPPIKLMVVGRATNDWLNCCSLNNLQTVKQQSSFAEEVYYNALNHKWHLNSRGWLPPMKDCPMNWVNTCWGNMQNNYNSKLSSFWRVIRKVVHNLDIADVYGSNSDNWASFIVWSNLYKISPSKGGNPGARLQKAQESGCIKLLSQEINTSYTPSRILFITDSGWLDPFKQIIPNLNSPSKSPFVKYCTSTANAIKVVVAVRSEAKKEDDWVKDICNYL